MDFVALDAQFKQIDDVRSERWTKQIFNGAWNPITAIFGLETHQLLASPYLQLVRQLATETYNVAVHMGIALPEDLPDRTIELARTNPSLAPSMLQDARKKKLMEVDSLCGLSFSVFLLAAFTDVHSRKHHQTSRASSCPSANGQDGISHLGRDEQADARSSPSIVSGRELYSNPTSNLHLLDTSDRIIDLMSLWTTK